MPPISPDRLADVFDATPVALLVFDRDLTMVHANPAYLQAVGMELEDIAGRNVFDVFGDDPEAPGPSQAQSLKNVMMGAIEHGRTQRLQEYPYNIPNASGAFDRRLWNVVEVPLMGADGRADLVVHYTEDVTELVDARAARVLADTISEGLQLQVDEAQDALRLRAAELETVNRQLAEALAHDRSIAATLQTALLSALPEVEHLGLVASYRPAVDQVGGDWYDVIDLPTATTIVIGDVLGHDTRAAASMGQLKSMLRVLTWMEDTSPASVLRRLDLAVLGLRLEVMASALVGRVTRVPEVSPGMLAMSWSSAGHPPPLLIHPGGEVELIEVPDGLLLGVQHRVGRTDTTTLLEPGARVLLYTDGLVERRDEPLDAGLARLTQVVGDCLREQVSTADLTEAVIDRMVGSAADDDIAVLVVENPA
ncbi:PP2C family protein-serine/threonine phosphatase [Nocardioides marmoribigeumensis]|nr:SpoIIE family protein phosphatase [Nocardioides marmoribigeumensis]